MPRQAMDEYERAINFDGATYACQPSVKCGKTTTMIRRIERLIVKDGSRLPSFSSSPSMAPPGDRKAQAGAHKAPKGQFRVQPDKNPRGRHLHHRQLLLQGVREFFNVADIPPQFSIIEENDSKLYRAKVISKWWRITTPRATSLSSCRPYFPTTGRISVISAVEQFQ